MQPKTAEEKILCVLEKIKEQYEVGPKTPTTYVPMGRGDTRRAIEVIFITGFLITECGVSYQEFKKILGRLKEDGVILQYSGTDIPRVRIWLNTDFEEQYKRYRTELGDKRTVRTLDVVTEAQERAARDLAIVSGQMDVFASQFSAISVNQEEIKKRGEVFEFIQKDIEARQKVFEALTRSMTPVLDVARDAQRTIEQLGIGKSLEQLREPIERLNVSATEMVRVVDSVQISLVPPVGEVVLPPPKRRGEVPTPALTISDDGATLLAQVKELVGIVRKIEQKLPELAQTSMIKISLTGTGVQFDDTKPAILVGARACPLPPAKNEEYLARAMFSRPVGEFVDWSIIHQEMTGVAEVVGDEKDKKAVRDTMDRLNKRVQEVIGTDDELLGWENKSIRRNY